MHELGAYRVLSDNMLSETEIIVLEGHISLGYRPRARPRTRPRTVGQQASPTLFFEDEYEDDDEDENQITIKTAPQGPFFPSVVFGKSLGA